MATDFVKLVRQGVLVLLHYLDSILGLALVCMYCTSSNNFFPFTISASRLVPLLSHSAFKELLISTAMKHERNQCHKLISNIQAGNTHKAQF